MSSEKDSDDGKKHLLKLKPSKFQNVTEYVLFYYFVIVINIAGEFLYF